MDSNKFLITTDQPEITIREGAAPLLPDPINPVNFDIAGNIETPANWVVAKKDAIDLLHAYAMVDKDSLIISLFLNNGQSNGRLVSSINGVLKLSDKFQSFKINQNYKWSLKELANHLKFNRRFFSDSGLNATIVNELKNFTASLNSIVERKQDDRGNRRNLIDRTFKTNVPEKFTLSMPIIPGGENETFEVEILIDGGEEGTKVWLQSIDLEEIINNTIDRIFNEQIDILDTNGITVLSK